MGYNYNEFIFQTSNFMFRTLCEQETTVQTHTNTIARPQNITPSAQTPNANTTFLRLSTLPAPAAALLVVDGLALVVVVILVVVVVVVVADVVVNVAQLVSVPLPLPVDVISVIVVDLIGPPGFVRVLVIRSVVKVLVVVVLEKKEDPEEMGENVVKGIDTTLMRLPVGVGLLVVRVVRRDDGKRR